CVRDPVYEDRDLDYW
nr:immunoglobulin heavy chain junction region [Macaca mulatta]